MRATIGWTALALGASGAFLWLSVGQPMTGGFLLRSAALLGALWFGYPAIVGINRRTIWIVALAAVVALARPRSLLVVLPVLVWFLRTRKRAAERAEG